jgi:hypothetical protein
MRTYRNRRHRSHSRRYSKRGGTGIVDMEIDLPEMVAPVPPPPRLMRRRDAGLDEHELENRANIRRGREIAEEEDNMNIERGIAAARQERFQNDLNIVANPDDLPPAVEEQANLLVLRRQGGRRKRTRGRKSNRKIRSRRHRKSRR